MDNARFAKLGYLRPRVACFVRCTPACSALVEALDGDKSQRRNSMGVRSPGKAAAAAAAGGKFPSKGPKLPSKAGKSPAKVALPAPPVVTAPLAAAMPAPPGAAAVAMLPGEEGGVWHVVRSPGMGLAASALARSPAGAARRRSSIGVGRGSWAATAFFTAAAGEPEAS